MSKTKPIKEKKEKALYTIALFGLDSEPILTELAKDVFAKQHPKEMIDLVTKISTYIP